VPVKDAAETRRLLGVYFALNLMQGYLWAINGTASKYIADDFGLSEAALASYFGLFGLGAFGTLGLARLADRLGRRRLMLAACAALPLVGLGSFFAPTAWSYAAVQVVAVAILGTLFAVSVVVLTEELPLASRARGQGLIGLASGVGAGTVLVLIAVAVEGLGSWRWLWLAVVPGVLLLPRLRRTLPETGRFEIAAGLGQTERARMRQLLEPPYRGRTLGILGAAFLGNASNVAAMTWGMYHLLENLALPQAQASGLLLVGGLLVVAGFPLGGRLCDTWGRRGTGVVGSLVGTVGSLAFFWAPPNAPLLVPLLALAFGVGGMARTAKMIAWRTSATELFPTRLRAAMQGLSAVMAATSAIAAQLGTAALVPLAGGLIEAASVMVLLGVPAAIVFLLLVPETRGIELESASLDEESVPTYVALGSNLGDRAAHLEAAIAALAATPRISVARRSPVYETAPASAIPQGPYLNAVVELRTTLSPEALLVRLLEIEAGAGRTRDGRRDAPRSLDLDLLLYGDRRVERPGLVVPHPRLHERPFVLEPLRDLAPELVHPVLGETVEKLAARVRDPRAVRRVSPAG